MPQLGLESCARQQTLGFKEQPAVGKFGRMQGEKTVAQ